MDRYTSGFIAGALGGILMNLWSFFAYHVINWEKHRFVDWTSVMLYGKLPKSASELIIALLVHIFFVSFLGSIFALLVPVVKSKQNILKGISYAIFLSFVFFAIPTLFREPTFGNLPVNTVISNLIGASIWGWSLGYFLHKMDQKYGVRM